jgi:hypothetical protein
VGSEASPKREFAGVTSHIATFEDLSSASDLVRNAWRYVLSGGDEEVEFLEPVLDEYDFGHRLEA